MRIQHLSFVRKSDSDLWNKAIVAAAGSGLEGFACWRVCVLMAKLDCQGILPCKQKESGKVSPSPSLTHSAFLNRST